MFKSADNKIEGKCSAFSISSVVKACVVKIYNIDDNLRGILNPDYSSKRNDPLQLGYRRVFLEYHLILNQLHEE